MFNFFNHFFEIMREGVYAFDTDGKITHFNSAAQTLLGYSQKEITGKIGHFIFHSHSGQHGLLHCSLYKAFLQKQAYEGDEVFITKDGRFLQVHVRANPLCFEGKNEGYVVLFWEQENANVVCRAHTPQQAQHPMISSKKQGSEASFYEQIFETANLGICLIDKEGRFVASNPMCCKIYGYDESELIGQSCTIVVPPESQSLMKSLHHQFMNETLSEFSNEWEIIRKDGTRIFVYASIGLLKDIVGGPYKMTTIFDITPMIEARRVQKEHEAMLVQQNKLAAMGELIGHIAHQWRQPLNVINLTTLDMKCKLSFGNLDEAILETSLDTIGRITDQMSQTIDDFMNFYKPNKEKRDFALCETIEYALNIVAKQLEAEGITLSLNLDRTLSVYGLGSELQQVVLNLIANAKDAFKHKALLTKQICIVVTQTSDATELWIEDNAGGIDESIKERIFEPYFTTKGQMHGSGIGLYISSMIMRQSFEGAVRMENIYHGHERIGARFILSFPNVSTR